MVDYKQKGNEALKEGRFAEAIIIYTKGIELNPSDHLLYSNRSAAHLALKRYKEALEDAEKTIELQPNWAKGYMRKANTILVSGGQLEDALATLEKALQVDSEQNEKLKQFKDDIKHAIENKNEGNKALKEGRVQDAINSYTKALEHAKDNILLLSNRSAAYHSIQKYQEAYQDGSRVTTLNPTWWKGYLRVGNALVGMGRFEEAIQQYQKGLEFEKNDQLESLINMVKKMQKGGVKQIQSINDFENTFSNAGNKLIVIDWFATWCGPCKFIAPHFQQLSNDYPNVIFLKVDVDQLKDLAIKYGIEAMPTFQFFKNGKKLDEIKGADINGVRNLIEKYK